MTSPQYHLGCPVWSNRDWVGSLFPTGTKPKDFLRLYSTAFNTVEGNNCFYGLPKSETVIRWRDESAPGFRFCFKFPRSISHEQRLRNTNTETAEFLERLEPLAESDKLGPSFLQLPPSFAPSDLPVLRNYLAALPQGFQYAVEVRHPTFFAKGQEEQQLNRLLFERNADRVMLDSCALFSIETDDPEVATARSKKPRLPVHAISLGVRPFIRYIGHSDVEANRPFLLPWLDKLVLWLAEGRKPYFFAHTPNNHHAPALARLIDELLRAQLVKLASE